MHLSNLQTLTAQSVNFMQIKINLEMGEAQDGMQTVTKESNLLQINI